MRGGDSRHTSPMASHSCAPHTKSVTGTLVLWLLPQVQKYSFSPTTTMLVVTLHSQSLTILIHQWRWSWEYQHFLGWRGSGTAETAITTSSPVPCITSLAAGMQLQPNWKLRLWKGFSSANFMPYFALLQLLVQQGPGKAKFSGQPFCLFALSLSMEKTCQCMHNSEYSAVIMCGTPSNFEKSSWAYP